MCHTRALFAAPMRRRSSGAAPRSKGGRGASRRVYTNVRSNELYEAEPERDSRIQRADRAAEPAPEVALDELPASYDDEEIAEDLAWTAEDRVRWGHLDDEGDEDGAEAEAGLGQRRCGPLGADRGWKGCAGGAECSDGGTAAASSCAPARVLTRAAS